jgi:hypothetical protein
MSVETDCQIENGRTRMTRYRLAPGANIGFHRHANDTAMPMTM